MVFRLPNRLRPETAEAPLRAGPGNLNREGEQWFCDVGPWNRCERDHPAQQGGRGTRGSIQGAARVVSLGRAVMGKEFRDEELLERARELEGTQSGSRPIDPARPGPALDDPGGASATAHIAGAEAEALAHRAYQRALKDAKTTEGAASVLKHIRSFFPKAA